MVLNWCLFVPKNINGSVFCFLDSYKKNSFKINC